MAIIRKVKRSVSQAPLEYFLPTEKSKPVQDLGGYSMLIYGRKKIGKTSLAARFPDAMFLMFEPGGKALSIFQSSMPSWLLFEKALPKIIASKFKTVVIDTADFAYDRCMEQVCKELGIDHPADAGWGKGWQGVKKRFNTAINKLLHSGKGVVFISHQREEEIEERSGKKYHRKTNTLSGQAKEALEGVVDIWANYDYDNRNRFLTVLGDDFTDAGHRVEHSFRYVNGDRIRRIPMGKNSEEAYQNLTKAFNNKLLEAEKGEGQKTIARKGLRLRKTN